MAFIDSELYDTEWVATFTRPSKDKAPFTLTRQQRKQFALILIRKQRYF